MSLDTAPSPPGLEDGVSSFLVEPLWERQQKLQAYLSCRSDTCRLVWEGWHIPGISKPRPRLTEPPAWLLCAKVTLGVTGIPGTRPGRDSVGGSCHIASSKGHWGGSLLVENQAEMVTVQ